MSTLSRVAENLYWMGRYIERAEGIARLVEVNSRWSRESTKGAARDEGWAGLLTVTGSEPSFAEQFRRKSATNVVDFLLVSRKNPSSACSSVQMAREDARTVRDAITREVWEHLNELHLEMRGWTRTAVTRGPTHPWTDKIRASCQEHVGVVEGTLSRTPGYAFIVLGRNIERADMTTRLLDFQTLGAVEGQKEEEELDVLEDARWRAVLRSMSAYQMYRATTQSNVTRTGVVSFLLYDRIFPRSVRHCLDQAVRGLGTLPRHKGPETQIRNLIRRIDRRSSRWSAPGLHRFIDRLQLDIGKVHGEIANTYFRFQD